MILLQPLHFVAAVADFAQNCLVVLAERWGKLADRRRSPIKARRWTGLANSSEQLAIVVLENVIFPHLRIAQELEPAEHGS